MPWFAVQSRCSWPERLRACGSMWRRSRTVQWPRATGTSPTASRTVRHRGTQRSPSYHFQSTKNISFTKIVELLEWMKVSSANTFIIEERGRRSGGASQRFLVSPSLRRVPRWLHGKAPRGTCFCTLPWAHSASAFSLAVMYHSAAEVDEGERLWEAWWISVSSDVVTLFRLGLWQSLVHIIGRRSAVWHSLPGCQSLPQARVRRRGDQTVHFQTARYQTATLLLSAPNVFAQPAFIGKGTRGNNGACSVASRAPLSVVCSNLLVLTRGHSRSNHRWSRGSTSLPLHCMRCTSMGF